MFRPRLAVMEKLKVPPSGHPCKADWRRTAWRTRYALLGGVTLVAAASLIVWHFWNGRGDVLKADGGPVVTVMDFGRSFPLDPLPSGWKHRSRPSSWWRFGTVAEGRRIRRHQWKYCLQSVRPRAAIDGMADCAAATVPLSSPAPSAHRCAAAGLDSSTAAERLASMPSTAQWIA
jgi:hypothetical protein